MSVIDAEYDQILMPDCLAAYIPAKVPEFHPGQQHQVKVCCQDVLAQKNVLVYMLELSGVLEIVVYRKK